MLILVMTVILCMHARSAPTGPGHIIAGTQDYSKHEILPSAEYEERNDCLGQSIGIN